MTDALTNCWGNPSALYQFGMEADHRLRQARKSVARGAGRRGGPGLLHLRRHRGRQLGHFRRRGAAAEAGPSYRHHGCGAPCGCSIPWKKLQAQGFEVTFLQPGPDGAVSLEAFTAALRPDTILASVMMVNNESGAVMPIAEMVRAVRRKSPLALFHTDAVQGFGKVPFKAKTLGADLITISSHKVHGPKGAGALYVKKGLQLPPLLLGGGQESGYRSGTEGMPAIVGFGAACAALDIPAEIARLTELRDACRASLSELPGVQLLGGRYPRPISSPCPLPGLRSQGILNCLQDRGICVSAGSACAKGHRSHVLSAMGLLPQVIDGAIRVSFGRDNTLDDVAALREGLLDALRILKG